MFAYLYKLFGYFFNTKTEPKENYSTDENVIETEIVEGETYECMKPNPQFDVCIEELSAFLEGIKSHCCIEDSGDEDDESIFNIDDLALDTSVD